MTYTPHLFSLALASIFMCACAPSKPAEPLGKTTALITEDAERFAKLMAETNYAPDAGELQEKYLDPGTRAIKIFTNKRIRSADHLLKIIEMEPEVYKRGVDFCLPVMKTMSPDLREIYAKYETLLDKPELPEAYVVFGANNSGGTGKENAFVLGLEVICRAAKGDSDALRNWIRRFIAHEVVHTLQPKSDYEILLGSVMSEGSADFIAERVVGGTLNDAAAQWYIENKQDVWPVFKTVMYEVPDKENGRAPWLYAGKSQRPEGWPSDLGYVIGADIARTYYENAADKRQAMQDILASRNNARTFLEKSGYLED